MKADWTRARGYRRVGASVTLAAAKERLRAWHQSLDAAQQQRLWCASRLAEIIWPNSHFGSRQGAGRCAASVLTKIKCQWRSRSDEWGWDLNSLR